jgi:hypothetical protein
MELKVKNYVMGFNEVGLDTQQIYDHFKEFTNTDNLDIWFTSAGDPMTFKNKISNVSSSLPPNPI